MVEHKLKQAMGLFLMSCRVEISIRAEAEIVWRLLTNAEDVSRWNSTVTQIEGQIREGERLRIRVPGTDRTFTPTVSDVVPNKRMTWTGGFAPMLKGIRTFELKRRIDSLIHFTMEERWSGLMLPLAKGSMPDFGPVFERYADDLKREAERLALVVRINLRGERVDARAITRGQA